MKADEIRSQGHGSDFWLKEIAAQLAEFNERNSPQRVQETGDATAVIDAAAIAVGYLKGGTDNSQEIGGRLEAAVKGYFKLS